jgi:hypothetical protein
MCLHNQVEEKAIQKWQKMSKIGIFIIFTGFKKRFLKLFDKKLTQKTEKKSKIGY